MRCRAWLLSYMMVGLLGTSLWAQQTEPCPPGQKALEASDYRAAASRFEGCLAKLSRERQADTWAATQALLGRALTLEGQEVDGKEGDALLESASGAYSQALEVLAAGTDWQRRGKIQVELGGVRFQQARRSRQATQRDELLRTAIELLEGGLGARAADAEKRRDLQLSQDRATLAAALRLRSQRQQGAPGVRSLERASQIYEASLAALEKQQDSELWHERRYRLAQVLHELGYRRQGAERVRDLLAASNAYEDALRDFRPATDDSWIKLQVGLGDQLMKGAGLLPREGRIEALKAAHQTYMTAALLPAELSETPMGMSSQLQEKIRDVRLLLIDEGYEDLLD